MKTKTEKKLDEEFETLGVKPRIYHFGSHNNTPLAIFTNITIALDPHKLFLSWTEMHRILRDVIDDVWLFNTNRATKMIYKLASHEIYGVAICDRRDQFNRQRGRIIAKGRLLKHLKKGISEK